jgi:hypothetical protein
MSARVRALVAVTALGSAEACTEQKELYHIIDSVNKEDSENGSDRFALD